MKVIQIHLRTFYFDENQGCHPDNLFYFYQVKYEKRFYSKEYKSIFYYINDDLRNLKLSKGVLLIDGVYPPLDLELLPDSFEIDINVNISNVELKPSKVVTFFIKGKDITP